jgi:lipoprotein-anchoring transpeptidase ErfK/SrfK
MEDDKINITDSEQEGTSGPDASDQQLPDNIQRIINSWYQRTRENKKLITGLGIALWSIVSLLTILFVLVFFIYLVPVLQEATSVQKAEFTNDQEFKNDQNYKKQTALISKDIQRLSKKYSSYTSGQSYIVINTTDNRFFLYRNKKIIREGFCSSGSYTMLKTEGERKWIFKTPKGKYWIQGKITSPVWKRPDWSFVEEGMPIPPADDPSRYEYGVLGDYAMSIGDGYLIHGTLYKRFLGMPVTHGCVRLNDEDLEAIYSTLSIGSKVYIF